MYDACFSHFGQLKGQQPIGPMKTVVLFAAHFPPSNLAGVHRARLWSQHLEEFGWRPAIVTTHWRYYEEQLDWALCDLLDPRLEVIRTRALPTKPVRLVGDIGIRGLPWHYRELRRLFRSGRVDFLHITVPSFYSAVLGEMLYRKTPIPFGIDYIDPWVHVWPQAEKRFSKAWLSMKLGEVLEPFAVRNASLITGVAEGYFEGVLERNPHLRERAVTAAMPYGFSELDFQAVRRCERKCSLFDPGDGNLHVVYAGAMLPKAYDVLDCFLRALVHLRSVRPDISQRIRVHFIGTGKAPDDPAGFNILPRANRLDLEEMVTEHPQRVPYADVLAHLTKASAILILGSTEPHYSPSKVYQAVQARRPVLALLHEASTAIPVLERSGAGVALKLTSLRLPSVEEVASKLVSVVTQPYHPAQVDWSAFDAYSAKESARLLSVALDQALEQFKRRNGPVAGS